MITLVLSVVGVVLGMVRPYNLSLPINLIHVAILRLSVSNGQKLPCYHHLRTVLLFLRSRRTYH